MIVRKGDLHKTIRVVVILLCWWIFSITAGLYNKDYLNEHRMPIYLTLAQSLAGVVCGAIILKFANLLRYPTTLKEIQMLWILTAFHAVGTILTNISTAASSASFMHTIKAAEPLFSAILAVVVLREHLKPLTVISLFVIVFGIALSCTTEFNFSFGGFLSAMASNVVFASRTIFSKKLLLESKLDNQNMFLYISLFTAFVSLVILPFEAIQHGNGPIIDSLTPGTNAWTILLKFYILIQAALSHYLYNVFSFLALVELNPISHGVSNSFKRLFVIYSSVLYFRNPVTPLNLIASAVAVGGVLVYSWSLRKK